MFVSHDPSAVERLCDRAIMLEHGRVVEAGTAADVVSAYHRWLVSDESEGRGRQDGRGGGPVPRPRGAGSRWATALARDRFIEGEPMALEVWLYAEQGSRARM